MNREEAIRVLSSYDVNGVWADVDGKPYNAEEQAEAFDMAIEALSAEAVQGDAISKRFVSDAILQKISGLNAQGEKAIPIAREFIRFKRFVDGITPTRAESVEVVRCGSCIHGQKILKAKEDVACDIWGGIWTENGFCSCGERRENENGKTNETGRGHRSY